MISSSFLWYPGVNKVMLKSIINIQEHQIDAAYYHFMDVKYHLFFTVLFIDQI